MHANTINRVLIVLFAGTVLLLRVTAEGQPPAKIHKIGLLPFATCRPANDSSDPLRQALAKHGYLEGENIVIECRAAPGHPEQHRTLAKELVNLKVDLLLAQGTPSALAARQATTTTPVVFFGVADPVASGLVMSLARPGGNVTGFSTAGPDQATKSLEVLKQGAPHLTRVAILLDLSNQAEVAQIPEVDAAAQTLGLKVQRVDVRSAPDLDVAFAAVIRERAQGLYLYPLRISRADVERIVSFAAKNRLPSVGVIASGYAAAGVLFFYTNSLAEELQRVGVYVDKILKGNKPADLPVEQPTKYELVINLKTAKALGLTIAPSLLLRADQIVE
jgi:putative ABC transport system substrate-binding protein